MPMPHAPAGESATFKKLLKKIAEHGAQEDEVIAQTPTGEVVIKNSRILIVLELMYNKFVQSGTLKAGEIYLDRMLGKPKESLNLTNGSDLIGKLSDDELTERISKIIKAQREGGAGATD